MTLVAKELDEELLIEGKANAEIKVVLLQGLTEKNLLRGTVKPAEMTEMQFQFELKKLVMQEREAKKTERA